MCGIAGIVSSTLGPVGRIVDMVAAQAHRGPDGEGFMLCDGEQARFSADRRAVREAVARVALGHRRLAILDTSAAGIQPMASPDGRDWVVFNGEIYNYRELREELRRAGFAFHTGTDTEVLLAAYRHWGTGCFTRFNGMWGVAIWDGERRRLVLSRDRFGVKPLHFVMLREGIAFASEIKALLQAGLTRPRLHRRVAADFLKWGLVNHGTDTFFADVSAFPAGHFAEIDPDRPDSIRPVRFWTLPLPRPAPSPPPAEAAARFRDLFESSVALRMRSDVPVGSCLSGGLDSSAIVMLAARAPEPQVGPFRTFTACAADPRYDERRYADAVNRAVGARSAFVLPEETRFLVELPTLVWHQDEPFTTASIYAQWCVMRAAREAGVPVLLDGQGGDEVLCGYRKFYAFYLQQLLRQGAWLRFLAEAALLAARGDRGMLRWREGARYLPEWLRRRTSNNDAAVAERFREAWNASRPDLGAGEDLRERQVKDLTQLSVPALLRYEDRNSMAWSIESRVPFLDYRIAEFAVALAPELKLRHGKTKALMRSALADVLPREILERRDKMGFVTPQELWMRGELGRAILTRLRDPASRLDAILDRAGLAARLETARARRRDPDPGFLFRAYVLDIWLDRFDVTC